MPNTRACALACLLFGLAACSDSNNGGGAVTSAPPPAPPPPNTVTVDVKLSSAEVVGGGAAGGTATASLTVNLDDLTVTGTVTLSGLTADGVTLNRGFAGENGPALIALEESSATEWVFPQDAPVTEADVDALESGALYLSVQTASEPGGAVRGQLLVGSIEIFFTVMTGAQEVPQVATMGSAMGAVTFDPATGALVVHVNADGLDDAIAAHVHETLAGANGDVIVVLMPDPDDPGHWLAENAELSTDQAVTLGDGGLYLNLHTPANPAGEVRGQIQPDGVEIVFTTLSAADVVPATNSTNSGVAATTILTEAMTMTINVNHVDLDDAVSTTVNQAPVGQNGPVVFTLSRDQNDLTRWTLADQSVTGAIYTALRNQGLYVLTTSPTFPDGELRGQLEPPMSSAGPADAFIVQALDPDNGAAVESLPANIELTFNRAVDTNTVELGNFELLASGGDGSFAEGNELTVTVVDAVAQGNRVSLDLTGATDAEDVYRLSASGLADESGVVLDGDGDGNPGGVFTSTFTVEAAVTAPTFTEIQNQVFSVSCAFSGCHAGGSPAAGMNLSAGEAFDNIVNVPSSQMPSLDRIEPGDPDASYLIRKIEGTGQGSRMPLGQAPLPAETIQGIRAWVSNGAPEN